MKNLPPVPSPISAEVPKETKLRGPAGQHSDPPTGDDLEAERVVDGQVVDELLRDEAGDGEHRDAAVLELLGLHGLVLGRVRGLEAQRVEPDVARVVRLLQLEERLAGGGRGGHPADLGACRLADADDDGEELEEGRGRLADVVKVAD